MKKLKEYEELLSEFGNVKKVAVTPNTKCPIF